MNLPSGAVRILNARSESPFAILGLPVGEVTEAEIEAAKLTQLARIDAHPERHTPAADDARLAVHVAAAQLADPKLRAQARVEDQSPARPATKTAIPAAPQIHAGNVPASWAAFAKQAGPVLAHAGGGINRRSLPLLGLLAARHGVAIEDVPLALRAGVAQRSQAPVAYHAEPAPHGQDEGAPHSPGRDAITILFVLLATIASVLLVVRGFSTVYLNAASRDQEPAAQADPSLAPLPEVALDTQNDTPPQDPLQAVTAAAGIAPGDPERAVLWLEQSFPQVADQWLVLTPTRREQAVREVAQVVRGAWSRSLLLDRVISVVRNAASANGLGQRLAAVEIASDLDRTADLPAAARPAISLLIGDIPGHAEGDEPSLLVMLRSHVDLLSATADPAAFSDWLSILSEISTDDQITGERIRAIDRTLTQHDHPSRLLSPVLRSLTRGLSTSSDAPLVKWIPRAFRNPAVSSAELYELTKVIASLDPLDAIDSTSVLPIDAPTDERTRLRARFEAYADPNLVVRDRKIVRAWAGLARSTLRRIANEGQAPSAEVNLERAVMLSRLTEAATWISDEDHAGEIIRDLRAPFSALSHSGDDDLPDDLFDGGSELDFVTRYERVRRTPSQLLALLLEAQSFDGSIAAPVAEIIAEEALLGTDRDSRDAAFVTVFALASEPVMLNAVLETLPRADRGPQTSEIIEEITGVPMPSIEDPDWPRAIRAAVLKRLLESLSQRGPTRSISTLASLLDVSYAARAADENPSSPRAGSTAEVSAAHLYAEAFRIASGLPSPIAFELSIEDIGRRARGREAIARGRVETFAARQASLFSVNAYTLAVEEPALSREIADLHAEIMRARRRASSLTEQISLVERGLVELWLIRFGERAQTEEESR